MTINSGSQQRIASCGDIRLAISGAADCTPVGVVASVHSHPDRRIRAWGTRTLRRFAHHSYPFRRQRFGRRPLRRTKSTPGKQCIQAAPRTQTKEQCSRKPSSLRGKSGTIKRHKDYREPKVVPCAHRGQMQRETRLSNLRSMNEWRCLPFRCHQRLPKPARNRSFSVSASIAFLDISRRLQVATIAVFNRRHLSQFFIQPILGR